MPMKTNSVMEGDLKKKNKCEQFQTLLSIQSFKLMAKLNPSVSYVFGSYKLLHSQFSITL